MCADMVLAKWRVCVAALARSLRADTRHTCLAKEASATLANWSCHDGSVAGQRRACADGDAVLLGRHQETLCERGQPHMLRLWGHGSVAWRCGKQAEWDWASWHHGAWAGGARVRANATLRRAQGAPACARELLNGLNWSREAASRRQGPSGAAWNSDSRPRRARAKAWSSS